VIRRRAALTGLAAALALPLAPPLLAPLAAHQQKRAISTIARNPRSGRLEIMHQVPVHDAEHALRAQGAKTPDIIGSAESREAFARYVARRFVLMVGDAAIAPDYVGSEISGGSLWVYQEAAAPAPGAVLRISSQILTDVWPRQENRVNIGSGTQVTTLIFTSGDAPQDALLPD
jgi:hypothetical protein